MEFESYPSTAEHVRAYIESKNDAPPVKGYFFTKAILKTIVFLALKLSWARAYQLGTYLGILFYKLKFRKDIAMRNLDIVYGEKKSVEEKLSIYRGSMITFGRLIFNYLRLPHQNAQFWKDHCSFKDEDRFKEIMNRKKGALIIAGHIGLWDLSGGKLGMAGYPVSCIGKAIRNPALNEFVINARQSYNLGTVKHENSMERVIEGIQAGEAVAMALDQNIKHSKGIFINWMGHTASSVRSAAYVAKKTGAPVVAGYLCQHGPKSFELVLSEEVEWEDFPDDAEKELEINTQKQSDAIQKVIYNQPELWFWIHRRWKNQPKGVPSPYSYNKS